MRRLIQSKAQVRRAMICVATRWPHVRIYGVGAPQLHDAVALEALLRAAARQAGAQVLGSHFHAFGEEDGVTGVVLLSESHISVHT